MNNRDFEKMKARLIKASGGKITAKDVEAIRKGDISAANGILSKEEKQTLLTLINNKAARQKILENPAIKDLLNGKR